ncbi:MAG: ABC transporter permease [Gemmatimonadota bacterium]
MADTPAVASIAIPVAPAAVPSAPRRPFPRVLQLMWRERTARLALLFLAVLLVAAIAAPWLAPFDPARLLDTSAGAEAPSVAHWFGTDVSSRDVLSRMLFGSRISLAIATFSAVLASGLGLLYGGAAGFVGGRVDGVMMRLVDALLAIPRLLLLLTVLALWGSVGVRSLVMILALTGWFGVARLARVEASSLRRRDFVVAARALGATPWRVFVRHVLPHASAPVLVATTIAIGQVIVLEAGLSYLGYGVPQPTPTWGNIIRDGRDSIATAWWLTLFPGLALVGTALAVNTIADRLRAVLNPRQLPAP